MHTFTIHGANGPVGGLCGGAGAALIMVPGLGSSSRIWGDLPSQLSRQFRVFAVDNRGIGLSREGRSFTLDAAADDIGTVIEEFEIDSVALLGASMGGVVALKAAIRHPNHVRRLALLSCSARLSDHGRRTLKLLQLLLAKLSPSEFGRALMHLAFAPSFSALHPEFVSRTIESYGLCDLDVPGAQAQLDHLLQGWDLRSEAEGLSIPSLVLAGRHDMIVDPRETRELSNILRSSSFVEAPAAGHSVLAEGGPDLYRRLVSFLACHP